MQKISRFYTLHQYSLGFRISNIFGHPISGSGGRKTFKQYLKSEHTDRQSHRQTDRQTHRQTHTHTHGQIDIQKSLTQRADALKKQRQSRSQSSSVNLQIESQTVCKSSRVFIIPLKVGEYMGDFTKGKEGPIIFFFFSFMTDLFSTSSACGIKKNGFLSIDKFCKEVHFLFLK